MADNYRMFLFEEEKKTSEEPKVVKPKTGYKKSNAPIDSKYSIDEKEFEPIVIDNIAMSTDSEDVKRIKEQEKNRQIVEEMVEEAKRKKEEIKNSESNVVSNEIPKIEGIKQVSNTVTNNNISRIVVDDKAKLRAQAYLSMPTKRLDSDKKSGLTTIQKILKVALFPFYRPKPKFNVQKSLRSDFELMAETARQSKIERDRKALLIEKEIQEEAKRKKVTDLNVDNAESGIVLSNEETETSEILKLSYNRNTGALDDKDKVGKDSLII